MLHNHIHESARSSEVSGESELQQRSRVQMQLLVFHLNVQTAQKHSQIVGRLADYLGVDLIERLKDVLNESTHSRGGGFSLADRVRVLVVVPLAPKAFCERR